MRLHITLSLICTFLLIANCGEKKKGNAIENVTPQDCINEVLKQDDSLGTIRNHACETISLSATIEQYVNSVNNLNFKNCPSSFHMAFQNHAKAWTKMGEFTKNYAELRGEMHDLFDNIEKSEDSASFKPLLKHIWDTWKDVEHIKSQYE